MTRSVGNWHELPGSFDTTNSYLGLFAPAPGPNKFGIPQLAPPSSISSIPSDSSGEDNESLQPKPPQFLAGYHSREASLRDPNHNHAHKTGLHFYLDDYRFETVWSRPRQTLSGFVKYGWVLTPDFSLYRDWPLAAQIWNVYRSRWLGAYWQAQGLRVVPTVSWSTPASYEFCFLGIEPGGWVSVSNIGVKQDRAAELLFAMGFETMLERLKPSKILWYGDQIDDSYRLAVEKIGASGSEIVMYPTRWQLIRSARQQQGRVRDGNQLLNEQRQKTETDF